MESVELMVDAEPFQELLEGLNFPSVSYQTTTDGRYANYEAFIGVPWEARVAVATTSVTASQRNGPADARPLKLRH